MCSMAGKGGALSASLEYKTDFSQEWLGSLNDHKPRRLR